MVDGQQRLATFAMLISRLKRKLLQLSDELPDGHALKPVLAQRAETLTNSYEIYQDEIRLQNVEVPRVQLSVPDQPFFTELLAGAAVAPVRKSHVLMAAADARIGAWIEELLEDNIDEESKAVRLQTIHDVLRADWTIIHMAAAARSDAYLLFQVLNDRGVSLTEGELLRSATLEALEQAADLAQIEEVEDLWNGMLGAETHVVTNAFGWLYAAQLGSWPSRGTMLEDYLAAFFPAVPKDGEMDARLAGELIAQVRSVAADFKRVQNLVSGEWPLPPDANVTTWERNRLRLLTKHLRFTDCVSLLVAGCTLAQRKFVELVLLIERFAFRYTSMADGPPDKARAVLNRHAVDIRRDPGAFRMKALREDLAALVATHAPDETFRPAIEQLCYSHTERGNKQLKYFLITLEDYTTWYDNNPQGAPVCRDHMRLLDFETGTIEHVYSQNADAPDVNLELLVDTLGNLTLLSGPENDRAANKPYIEKRAIFAGSTSMMNRRIAENAEWTRDVVEARTTAMTNAAMRIFAI